MYNPRNAYQNYGVATNTSDKTLYTYMGKLLPHYGNATYSSAGQLSPLLNDPQLRTIGIGTRIFLGGGVGYVAWEGTQYKTTTATEERRPGGAARSLALVGDLSGMSTEFVRALNFQKYGAVAGRRHRRPDPDTGRGDDEVRLDPGRPDLRPAARLRGPVAHPQADQGDQATRSCAPGPSSCTARRSGPPRYPSTTRPGSSPGA